MKPSDVIVRFRLPTSSDPSEAAWRNSGETHWFKSFRAAWAFIRDSSAYHPLTGDLLAGEELAGTVHRSKLEDSGIYYLDVFGKDERKSRDVWFKQLLGASK